MIWVPVVIFAIHLEMNSETREPAKPNTAQNTSRLLRFRSTPLAAMNPLKPNRLRVMLATSTTARLVATNNRMRIMVVTFS
ncbi:hypothetical protein D9M71_699900 [compost metagenome]